MVTDGFSMRRITNRNLQTRTRTNSFTCTLLFNFSQPSLRSLTSTVFTQQSHQPMGQSNSTSPLMITESNEAFKDFNYSRLIPVNQSVSGQATANCKSIVKKAPPSYFRLNRFESLNGDDLLVKEREEKVSERFESENSTLKNISNLKLSKHPSSILNSKAKITSIAQLQLPSDSPHESLKTSSKPTHVKFHSCQRLMFKNYIIQKSFSQNKKKFTTKVLNYFVQEEDMEHYVSNLIKLKQVLTDLQLYEDFVILQEDGLFIVERYLAGEVDLVKGRLNRDMLRDNAPLLLEYLSFLGKVYSKMDNIYIDPEDVYYADNEFFLINFRHKELDPFDMILATLEWAFKSGPLADPNKLMEEKMRKNSQMARGSQLNKPIEENVRRGSQFYKPIEENVRRGSQFNKLIEEKPMHLSQSRKNQRTLEQCFTRKDELQNAMFFPFYVRELWKNLVEKKITRHELLPYITRLKYKAQTLTMKIDSFHACVQLKKTSMFQEEKHGWILGKRCNEVYFYNINDDHRCHVKVIRKKKKIDLSQIKIVFDPEELELKYIAQNSKLVIHISQFQLEKCSCLSDIQIKHRLPIKFKNPFLFYTPKTQQIIILQNCVYKYSIGENKITQQTKKIPQTIFLARSYERGYMVVKLSIDIFKNGIKLFVNHSEVDLYFVGDHELLEDISNIRVDVRTVELCKEIYKGVYVMLANRNFWVLDLNFCVFYSLATIERIKQFYGFASVANSANHSKNSAGHSKNMQKHSHNHTKSTQTNTTSDYAFQIFNQPFKVQFLSHQQGLHAKIKDEQLHIIGQIQGNMYYLNYLFMPEAGTLKLLSYKPLFAVETKPALGEDTPSEKSCNSDQSIEGKKKEKKQVKIAEEHVEFDLKSNAQTSTLQLPKQPTQTKLSRLSANLKLPNAHPMARRSRQLNQLSIMKFIKQPTINMDIYQFYHFNFHEQNLPSYKNEPWLFLDQSLFIRPEDFFLKTNKTNYEIQLKIKKTKYSLKDLIEIIKKSNQNKSLKQRKTIPHDQVLLYMLRCLQIYQFLIQHDLNHKNLAIANLYFMDADNSLKLIGWSEPPRNWYVSDFKDLLLVCFNIITCNSLEKLNDKILYKYKNELEQFPVIYEKMQSAFKLMKMTEKKSEIEKEIKEIRESLLKHFTNRFLLFETDEKSLKNIPITSQRELIQKQRKDLAQKNANEFIFNFEYNTPRFAMVSTLKKKMKKMKCLIDQNSKQELIFKASDKYLWNEQKGSLYMFTTAYQFYEIQINVQSFKQQTLVCEQYEYLPNNVVDSTFVYVRGEGIVSIGGIYKGKDTQLVFNRVVYKFNFEKLTWDAVCEIPEPRVNPYVILSKDDREIYCIGGQTEHETQNMHVLKMELGKENSDKAKASVKLLVDPQCFNPLSQVLASYPSRIYSLSSQLQLFLLFAITGDKYLVRVFSLNSFCMDLQLQAKNYSDDNNIISSGVGISLIKGTVHVLRQYGKYAKIGLNRLENLTVVNQTVYPEREDKVDG